ncbi:MAG: zf-HC2 domain-containing protein [Acidimicrobiales bacterium]|jgi:anti-sigma factor RsiW
MVRLLSAWRRDLVCRDAVALMTDYLEGALSPRQRARLERHLAGCDGCDEYLRQMRLTIDVLGRVEPEDLPIEARDELVELFLRFQAEGDDGPGA